MKKEETLNVKTPQVNNEEEQKREEFDTANRWIPVALKLAVANSEEEAHAC